LYITHPEIPSYYLLHSLFLFSLSQRPPTSTLFPYTDALPIFASEIKPLLAAGRIRPALNDAILPEFLATRFVSGEETFFRGEELDRKSTRLNSSHVEISYAVFCLKKKNKQGTC